MGDRFSVAQEQKFFLEQKKRGLLMCFYIDSVCDHKILTYVFGTIQRNLVPSCHITAGRLPLEVALALGVGLFESLLVTCLRNHESGRKENWAGVVRLHFAT